MYKKITDSTSKSHDNFNGQALPIIS